MTLICREIFRRDKGSFVLHYSFQTFVASGKRSRTVYENWNTRRINTYEHSSPLNREWNEFSTRIRERLHEHASLFAKYPRWAIVNHTRASIVCLHELSQITRELSPYLQGSSSPLSRPSHVWTYTLFAQGFTGSAYARADHAWLSPAFPRNFQPLANYAQVPRTASLFSSFRSYFKRYYDLVGINLGVCTVETFLNTRLHRGDVIPAAFARGQIQNVLFDTFAKLLKRTQAALTDSTVVFNKSDKSEKSESVHALELSANRTN